MSSLHGFAVDIIKLKKYIANFKDGKTKVTSFMSLIHQGRRRWMNRQRKQGKIKMNREQGAYLQCPILYLIDNVTRKSRFVPRILRL